MTGGSLDSIRVLHVDDEPEFADLAGTFLEREDDRFDVETAAAPSEAVDRLPGERFDCIVSDYDMPRTNGIEFLEQVRERWPDIPFILFTGKGSEEVASEAISVGVTDYIQKRSGSDQYALLANRIKNAVERRAAEQERNRQVEAIETAREGISILDEDGHYIYLNQRFADLHGYDSEELIGEHWELVYPDDDTPEVREEILPEVEQVGHWHGETTSLRADGNTVPVDHTLALTDRGELVCTVRDLTDRKQRKRELERYERIVENLPVGVFRTTPDGDIVDVNDEFVSLFDGDSKDDFADVEAVDLYAEPTDRERLLHRLEAEGFVDGYRHAVTTLDDEIKWVETTLQITHEDGDRYLDGIVQDLTGQRERQKRLKQAQTMFRNTQDAVFLIDVGEEFTVERVNPAYEEMTGFSEDGLADRTPRDILGDEQGAEVERRYRECANQRTPLQYNEELLIDGKRTRWDTRVAPVVIDGEVEKIVGATREITERKERERELERYQTIVETAPDPIAVVDTDGRFQYVNPALCDLTGYDEETLRGQHFSQVKSDAEAAQTGEAFDRLMGADETTAVRSEAVLQTAGDDPLVCEDHMAALHDGDVPRGAVIIHRDITERVRREKELKRQQDRLDEFASVVRHDLRNPLRTVEGRLELAVETGDVTHAEPALTAIDRMDELIDDIAAVMQSGAIVDDERAEVDIGELTRATWETTDTDGSASLRIAESPRVVGDPDALRRMLDNFLGNVVEHGDEDVTVRVGELDDGFYIEDDGPGIPEDEREDIFEPGYSTKEGGDGTGLGMTSVQQIVHAHDWEIHVTEGTDGGARFEITGVAFSAE